MRSFTQTPSPCRAQNSHTRLPHNWQGRESDNRDSQRQSPPADCPYPSVPDNLPSRRHRGRSGQQAREPRPGQLHLRRIAFPLDCGRFADREMGSIKNGGSDRLIDSIIAWGDLIAIRNRHRAHHSAGADHVCIQVLSANLRSLPLAEWREIAPALLGG